jgi:dTDP-4-amino-4,6-dideoxygalactose transaminase
MTPVPLLDLTAQYETLREPLDAALAEVVASQRFVMGPGVESFEAEMAEYLNVPHAIGCASGTDALLLPLKAMDPRPDDEVIVPAFTFFATAGAAWNSGFRPVFCDVEPDTFNVSARTLESAWTERARAIVPVHLFGQMAPMSEINALANARGALVLEDAAQAVGARQRLEGPASRGGWTMAGAAGTVGAFSFFPTKNLGGFGDGGLMTTSDPQIADRLSKIRLHGGRQMYHHEMVGTNSRLDALQAAVLSVKLPHLDGWAEARGANACAYHGALQGIPEVRLPDTTEGSHHVYNQYTLRVERRDELREFLNGRGIGSGIYYPVPLHLQECFSDLGYSEGDFPVSEALCREVISLPIFPELGGDRIEIVAGAIRDFYRGR